MREIRVIIADAAHSAGSIRELVDGAEAIQVLEHVTSSDALLRVVAEKEAELLLIDNGLPPFGGLEASARICAAGHAIRTLLATDRYDPAYLRGIVAAGGSGFLVKSDGREQFLGSLWRAMQATPIDGGPRKLFPVGTLPPGSTNTILSHREHEVLRLVAYGYTNREIAEMLDVAKKTVDTYRLRLSRKLGFKNRAQLVRYALDIGLLQPGD